MPDSAVPSEDFPANTLPSPAAELSPSATVSPAPPRPLPWRSLRPWERRLLGWLLLVFALHNFPWRLDEYDQAKQAYTSLEMVQGGQWAFQHLPGGKLPATKPPLVGWTPAAIYYLTGGSWDLAWRLPSFLAALAVVVLLWRGGEREWPGWGGLLAGSAFAFNLFAPRLATLVRTDMPLTLWITVVGVVVWRHVRDGGQPWDNRDRWLVCVALLASMLTKGPIAYAFLLPGMLVHSWLCHRRGHTLAHTWGGWWPQTPRWWHRPLRYWHWVLPLLPFLFWLERGIVTVPEFYNSVIGREFVGRFTVGKAAVHHNQPVWHYFLQLLWRWTPWSLLLLAVRFRARRLWWAMCAQPGTLWLICWAAGGLVFMSLVPSKRPDRIFPVVPPLCLVLTALLARAQRQAREDADQPPDPAAVQLGTAATPTALDLWPLRWSRWTVAGALLLAVGDAAGSIGKTYYRHEDARAGFAAKVRAATVDQGRRVELVVEPKRQESDETMLVYLRRLTFLLPGDAMQQSGLGQLDTVVLNDQTLASVGGPTGLLDPFAPSRPELSSRNTQPPYLLLSSRMKPPAPTPVPTRKPTKKR